MPEQIACFSTSTTRPKRRRARLNAMLVPMTPPPMTTASACSMPPSVLRWRRARSGRPPRGPQPVFRKPAAIPLMVSTMTFSSYRTRSALRSGVLESHCTAR